mmetsp:Transcript_84713/g.236425  ORF Transcript_84713/g.236425 Transcript_84713/m.236425 type:complete len:333 (+) Transcript_84713:701-1699(+)
MDAPWRSNSCRTCWSRSLMRPCSDVWPMSMCSFTAWCCKSRASRSASMWLRTRSSWDSLNVLSLERSSCTELWCWALTHFSAPIKSRSWKTSASRALASPTILSWSFTSNLPSSLFSRSHKTLSNEPPLWLSAESCKKPSTCAIRSSSEKRDLVNSVSLACCSSSLKDCCSNKSWHAPVVSASWCLIFASVPARWPLIFSSVPLMCPKIFSSWASLDEISRIKRSFKELSVSDRTCCSRLTRSRTSFTLFSKVTRSLPIARWSFNSISPRAALRVVVASGPSTELWKKRSMSLTRCSSNAWPSNTFFVVTLLSSRRPCNSNVWPLRWSCTVC